MFVTPTDFDYLPFKLANLGDVDTTFPVFVNQFEKLRLQKLFGVAFYNALVEGVAALPPAWDATASYDIGSTVYGPDLDIYISVIDDNVGIVPAIGYAWSLVAAGNRWLPILVGTEFTADDGTDSEWPGMKALVIPLIYGEWTKHTTDTQTGAGIVSNDAENGSVVSPNIRISRAFRVYRDIAQGAGIRDTNSLWDYLYANSTLFDDIPSDKYSTFRDYLSQQWESPSLGNEFDL